MLPPIRRLPLSGTANLRDLGGYPAEGGVTRFGMLYRSDGLSDLTDADRALLQRARVATVIDLRADDERQRAPSALAEQPDIAYHAVSLMGDQASARQRMELRPKDSFTFSLTMLYAGMADDCPEQFARVFSLLEQGLERGAVLFNCTAGKDRTGIVAAMTLALCGVSEADIVADYSMTHTYLKSKFARFLEVNPGAMPPEVMKSDPETIEAFLAHLAEKYGGPRGYLLAAGVRETLLASIVRQLVQPL